MSATWKRPTGTDDAERSDGPLLLGCDRCDVRSALIRIFEENEELVGRCSRCGDPILRLVLWEEA